MSVFHRGEKGTDSQGNVHTVRASYAQKLQNLYPPLIYQVTLSQYYFSYISSTLVVQSPPQNHFGKLIQELRVSHLAPSLHFLALRHALLYYLCIVEL